MKALISKKELEKIIPFHQARGMPVYCHHYQKRHSETLLNGKALATISPPPLARGLLWLPAQRLESDAAIRLNQVA